MRHLWILLIAFVMTACAADAGDGGRTAGGGGGGVGSGGGDDGGDDGNGSGSGSGGGSDMDLGGQGESCAQATDCMPGYSCIDLSAGDPTICVRDCDTSLDCDLSYHCCGLANVPKNVCVPDNVDNGLCMP